MATPAGPTLAHSTALANSWLTGVGDYSVYQGYGESSTDYDSSKGRKLTSFEALNPEQQSKIERILAYTFDIAPSLVKRFFSDLSCVQWSDTPNFLEGISKYLLLEESCTKVWREFFEQVPAVTTKRHP